MFREFFKGKGYNVTRMYCEARIVYTGKELNEQIMDNFNAFMINIREIPGW
ncbi:MAG: hypothetical protein ACTSWL_05525 [Promethearchaeota archaeon]